MFGAVAGVLVYFAYNRLVFGGAVPVSGAIKQAWSRQRWEQEGGYSFLQNFQDVLQLRVFDWELLVALGVCACLLLVWRSTRRSRSRDDWLLLAFLTGVSGVAAGHLAMFAQHVLMKHPDSSFWSWYYVPAYLMMALLVLLACAVAVHVIRRFVARRSGRMANILSATVIAAGAVFLLFDTGADFARPFHRTDASLKDTRVSWQATYYLTILTANRVLPEGSVIGAWDAGTTGYFSNFPVVSMDGLANDYDYRTYIDTAGDVKHVPGRYWMLEPQAGDLEPYFQRFGITHFIDYAWAASTLSSKRNVTLFESPTSIVYIGKIAFRLWLPRLSSTDGADWFWERMKPHFDLQQGDVGLTVDTRIAQVFARNCAPDDLAAVFWAGRNTGSFRTAPLKQNPNGLCVAAMLLPRDAGPVQRVAKIEVSKQSKG